MAVVQRARLIRVLDEDPDLAHRLDEREVELATRQTVGTLEQVPRGAWRPAVLAEGKSLFGGLILDGLLVRELTVGAATSAELLGGGDLVLPADADQTAPFVDPATAWTALEPTRVAWLDTPFAVAVRRWPELGAALLERSQRRFTRLAVTQAVSQLTRVDDRVLITLWHLSERWGRVRADGVLLPVRLTHRVLARLVGARRPSVTTALGTLEKRELISRRPDGSWLLRGSVPESLQRLHQPARPWEHGRARAAGLERVEPEPVRMAAVDLSPVAAFHARRIEAARQRSEELLAASAAIMRVVADRGNAD
jgi:CRP/FNR family transcriptional regulator, cyclic AMP receptor protein